MKKINHKNQMPTDEVFMSLIKVDRLYGYMQSISKWDYEEGGFRYVLKEDFSPTKVHKKMGVTRATVYNQLRKLLDNDFVEAQEDRYILKYNRKKYTTVAPEILEFLGRIGANDELLALYCYFRAMYRFYKNSGHQYFYFTRSYIVGKVWQKTCGTTNYEKLDALMYALTSLGLVTIKHKPSKKGDYRIYCVTYVADTLVPTFECI